MLATTLSPILWGLAVAVFSSILPAAYAENTGHNVTTSPLYPKGNTTLVTIKDDHYGVRNVSYFVADGLAIIDGDVVYGTVEDLLHHSQNPTQISRSLSVFTGPQTWPDATVKYKFDSPTTETTLRKIIDDAIARWKASAPYLTFTQVPNNANPENGVIMITATQCNGCWANIGYADAPLRMNLQQSCPGPNDGFCHADEATHEFGHVLGLYHEHQRPDRNSFVQYHCENLDPTCPLPTGQTCCSGGPCCGTAGNFDIIYGEDDSGPYDSKSIMQYRGDGFAKTNTLTLTPAQASVTIPTFNPGFPSIIDFERICKLYSAWCLKWGCKSCACADPRKAVPFYRYYSGRATDHFYTTNKADTDLPLNPYAYEEIAGYIFNASEPHTEPLYRLYNSVIRDHFYTTDIGEKNNAVNKLGYTSEGIAGYIYPDCKCGGLPLFRSYSSKRTDHFYTMLECEQDNAFKKFGYKEEGITGYMYPVLSGKD